MNKPNSRKPVRYKEVLFSNGYLVSIDLLLVSRRQDSIFVRKKAKLMEYFDLQYKNKTTLFHVDYVYNQSFY